MTNNYFEGYYGRLKSGDVSVKMQGNKEFMFNLGG